MIVTLKDGSKKEYAEAKSVIDIAYDISEGLARAAIVGILLNAVLPGNDYVFETAKKKEEMEDD